MISRVIVFSVQILALFVKTLYSANEQFFVQLFLQCTLKVLTIESRNQNVLGYYISPDMTVLRSSSPSVMFCFPKNQEIRIKMAAIEPPTLVQATNNYANYS